MTQEDKELLLKDLYARLPYGVKGKLWCYDNESSAITGIITMSYLDAFIYNDCITIKPYLRPMSSITEEETKEYKCLNDALDENYEVHIDNAYPSFDWLNAHHFDYRGLIEKGLALEAPEGMYK